MADIMLHTNNNTGITCVSNAFIDNFMKDANGEYVKIYLYLLRCLNNDGYEFSISQLADCLDHTEKDVMRAFAYWEKVGLLRLEYNSDNELSGIYFEDVPERDRPDSAVSSPITSATAQSVATISLDKISPIHIDKESKAEPSKPSYSPEQLSAFSSNAEVADLFYATSTYLGRPLSVSDTETILYWYDSLHMSIDLIEYLIETCIGNGHKSFYYMNKTALNWMEDGIDSVEMARGQSKAHSTLIFSVMKSMGISNRDLIPQEMDFINKWKTVYGFDVDIISEACKRTVTAINKPSFNYADSILHGWHESSVKSIEDITKLDEQFIAASTAKLQAAKARSTANTNNRSNTNTTATSNKFHNFSQRDYDFDELEKKIMQN